jgi:cytochrome c peroxidase
VIPRRPARREAGRRCGLRLGLAAPVLAGAAFAVLAGAGPIPVRDWLSHPVASFRLSQGWTPHPVRLVRPAADPLSAVARLGRRIFHDPTLSASGRVSCATCHVPADHYGPPDGQPAMMGGPDLASQGDRAVPSLDYLERDTNFSIGPDNEENETVTLAGLVARSKDKTRIAKTARDTARTAANPVPQGGLFWDGRADTLQQQTMGPLLNPVEMDGGSVARVAAILKTRPYAAAMTRLFGPSVLDSPRMTVAEAMFAVARFEIEDPGFHPYDSKFDAWLEGKARFTPAQLRGYLLFNDPKKADCGGCHLDRPTADGLPPLFTDHQYEALGVPRNPALAVNRDPAYYDLGLCGPVRTDLAKDTQYCGMFLTPTLRNVATRRVFFHNGIYHSLKQVLDFYDFRDVAPGRIYPRAADGRVEKFNDLPPRDRANIDRIDPPFDRKRGQRPAMSPRDEADIIAFLGTLTDGYKPKR